MTADSAGQSFGGRELDGTGFDADTGAADPALLEALSAGDETAMMAALADARLLVPIVAAAGQTQEQGGLQVEKSTDMAVVTLAAADGQRALPVFTGVRSLAEWDPAARPTPVAAQRAAQAAVSERCDVIVIDVAGEHPVALRPSMVWALAQHRPWLPAHTDPVVRQAVSLAARSEETVQGATCEAGDDVGPGVLRVVLALAPGLRQDQVQDVATRFGERLATDGEVRARIDALAFRVHAAG